MPTFYDDERYTFVLKATSEYSCQYAIFLWNTSTNIYDRIVGYYDMNPPSQSPWILYKVNYSVKDEHIGTTYDRIRAHSTYYKNNSWETSVELRASNLSIRRYGNLETPANLTVSPSIITQNTSSVTVSWNSITPPRANWGQNANYVLEKQINNNGQWGAVYRGNSTSTVVSLESDWETVQFRVRAYVNSMYWDTPTHIVPTSSDGDYVTADNVLYVSYIPARESNYRNSDTYNIIRISTPNGIIVPQTILANSTATITWGESTATGDEVAKYELQRSVDGGDFSEIVTTSADVLQYTDTIGEYTTVQYRVRGVTAEKQVESDWTTSDTRTIIHNEPPAISGYDKDLGTMYNPFKYVYTVIDPELDQTTVTEKLNGDIVRTYEATLGQQQYFDISETIFASLDIGSHTMEIVAIDSMGGAYTRTLTFTKSINLISVELKEPHITGQRPTRINILPRGNFPAGAIYKAYATNNAFDPEPFWEDCTQAVFSRIAHVFQNTMATSTHWGVNFKLEIQRGDSLPNELCTLNGVTIQWE
jgi:hypothetical protein